MFLLVMLLTSAVASPLYSTPRIELLAPPIAITQSPPHVPAPVYGTPIVTSEKPLISPVSIQHTQAPALNPEISGPFTQNEGSFLSPTTLPEDKVPIKPPEDLIHIPEGSISIPKGSNQLLLPPGTRINLRDSLGQFSHGFSDKNGTTVSEQGTLLNTNDDWEAVIIKKGFYSYISPDGTPISVSYVADENGFRAKGDHIPSQ